MKLRPLTDRCLSKAYVFYPYLQRSRNRAMKKSTIDVVWAHAINSQDQLNNVLKIQSNVTMIEADVLMGTLINDTRNQLIPIMCHPPNRTSDLTLDNFIKQIIEFNESFQTYKKGFKLDFKSTEVVENSKQVLQNYNEKLEKTTVWLNADILKGPINSETEPVKAKTLFELGQYFPRFELSLGWTTRIAEDRDVDGFYSTANIDEMLHVLKQSDKLLLNRKITFALRTIFAIRSTQNIQRLLNETNGSTVTLWTAFKTDNLECDPIKNFVRTIGVDKCYFDLPSEIIQCLKDDFKIK